MARTVFVTGGTGYVGGRLIPRLIARGHRVRALARPGSAARVPPGCEVVVGNPFDRASFTDAMKGSDTCIQLVGVPHPSPAKARQFVEIDLRSALETFAAAKRAAVPHIVYVSVAQPAPVMLAYLAARGEAERQLAASGLAHTIVRPWYVLGPGHRWPYALLPVYWMLERFSATKESARRLGLVTLDQMVTALVAAVEAPAASRIVEVAQIRRVQKDPAHMY